ncbi:hypothetical protein PVAND_013358 [Polypedilum vanderplanki]|uniref:REST corepressor n=1 Tax=Polypedilum vanderplanki TaxID=319348 RepID=A0A9J6CPG1_POLVA|nr:hypothetical protein PVAND_013358 [Polypedilum vanderplanki]
MNVDTKEVNKNGRKSSNTNSAPLPSPTAPSEKANNKNILDDLTPETSDDDSNSRKNLKQQKNGKSEYEEKIRVGKDYQAIVPEYNPKLENITEKALLVWSPNTKDIPDSRIEEYIQLAKERYGYNAEQALGMLFWHKHDLEKAVIDLANFTPFPEEWTKEDKILFEQAFQFHGKCFHRIRQMLPDKSIASLVKHYYSWKKTRSRTSLMDRQEKRKNEGGSENGSDDTPDNSDAEDKDVKRMTGINRIENKHDTGYSSSSSSSNGISKLLSLNCQNCKVLCNELNQTTVGSFCSSCFQHWRRTGELRPVQGPNVQRPRSKTNKLYYYQGYHDGSSKYKRKPPKGMYINHDDVLKLAAQDLNESVTPRKQPVPHKFDLLAETDREINVLYSQIQANKQKISSVKAENESFRESRLPEEIAMSRVNIRWTKDELSLAILGFRKFGQNFKAISEVISTKTESHVRKFFTKYRKSRDLDTVCQESQATTSVINAQQKSNSNDGMKDIEVMEIDSDDDSKSEKNNGNTDEAGTKKNSVKVQSKANIVVVSTSKPLKRKLDFSGKGNDDVCIIDDDNNLDKKFAPMLLNDNSEISIVPIRKSSADGKQNGKDATFA